MSIVVFLVHLMFRQYGGEIFWISNLAANFLILCHATEFKWRGSLLRKGIIKWEKGRGQSGLQGQEQREEREAERERQRNIQKE